MFSLMFLAQKQTRCVVESVANCNCQQQCQHVEGRMYANGLTRLSIALLVAAAGRCALSQCWHCSAWSLSVSVALLAWGRACAGCYCV